MRLATLQQLNLQIENDPKECDEYQSALKLIQCEELPIVWSEETALQAINIIYNKMLEYFQYGYTMNASWISLYDEFKICKSEKVQTLITESKIKFLNTSYQKISDIFNEEKIYKPELDMLSSYNNALNQLNGNDELSSQFKEKNKNLTQMYGERIKSKEVIDGKRPKMQNFENIQITNNPLNSFGLFATCKRSEKNQAEISNTSNQIKQQENQAHQIAKK
jgi:hypothetical protein